MEASVDFGALNVRRHRTVTTEAGLGAIHLRSVNLVLWKRGPLAGPSPAVEQWLVRLAEGPVVVREATIAPTPEGVTALFEGIAQHPGRDWLHRDMVALGKAFADVMKTNAVRMQLAVVASDRCRKFHADFVTVRGLCTYVGPGTEWVEETALDRTLAGPAPEGMSTAESNGRIVRDASGIHGVSRGTLALLKGSAYTGNAMRGLVHRSAPIEAEGRRRLVLKVDVPR